MNKQKIIALFILLQTLPVMEMMSMYNTRRTAETGFMHPRISLAIRVRAAAVRASLRAHRTEFYSSIFHATTQVNPAPAPIRTVTPQASIEAALAEGKKKGAAAAA